MKKHIMEFGVAAGIVTAISFYMWWEQKIFDNCKKLAEKYQQQFYLMEQWVWAKQNGKDFVQYFKRKNYKTISIYGMGDLGKRLAKELENSEIDIAYGIDRNAQNIYSGFKMLTLDDELPETDVIVVTSIYNYVLIKEKISDKVKCPIISLEDVLFDIISIEY